MASLVEKIVEISVLAGAEIMKIYKGSEDWDCLLYTSPSPRDATLSRMPSSA